jgi:type VI secretion system secreted protein Hcp
MAYQYWMTVTGSKSGKFKGDATAKGASDKIRCLAFEYEIVSPRDMVTGHASGKRQHHPITILKEWGPSSPQFLGALVQNEVLSSVVLEFVKVSGAGGEAKIYYTIKLTNASVTKVDQSSPHTAEKGLPVTGDHEYEWISLYFQKIEFEHINPAIVSVDEWD